MRTAAFFVALVLIFSSLVVYAEGDDELDPTPEVIVVDEEEDLALTYQSATDYYLLDPQMQQFSPRYSNSFFQTSLHTGSANYVYNIKTPPGTNGMTPQIILTYNSHNAKGPAGWAGLGWNLNLNYIQRNVRYTPDDTSDDSFELIRGGQKYDLVYSASDGRYHTKIESYLYRGFCVSRKIP